jgi:HK97 family phage portal protein
LKIETLAGGVARTGFDMLAPVEQRTGSSFSAGGSAFESATFGTETFSGRRVTPNTAMTFSAVFACVKILAEAIGSLPLRTYRNMSPDGLIRKLAVDDYRYRMLREQPNEEQSSIQWRQFMMASLTLWGNAYNWLEWDGRGRLKNIWPMRPEWMIIMRNGRTHELEYRYTPIFPISMPIPAGVYDPYQILHIAGLGTDGVVGHSPIAMCRNAVALGQAYEEQGGRFVAGGASQKLALVSAGSVKDPDELKKKWKQAYGGLQNSGEVAVLQGGLDVKTFGIPPKDAQFLEGRSWQLAEMARIFNVPLGMLNDALSKPETYASAEQADIRFVKHTIRPWCTLIEQKINLSVLGSQDALTCSHDLTDLYRGDLLSQAQGYNTLCTGGIMARNEARARLDLPPDPDPESDKLTVQAQMVPLVSIGKPASIAAADEGRV